MNRALVQKLIGLALILSGVVLLALKITSIPEAKENWGAWASQSSGTFLFIGVLAAELLFLAARFLLGYVCLTGKWLGPRGFYPLIVLVALSGLSGIILGVASLAIRFWQGQGYAAKT
jgi:small-conductance mechanosensitive channel